MERVCWVLCMCVELFVLLGLAGMGSRILE